MPAKFFTLNSTLQTQLEEILEKTWRYFPELAPNQLAVTWIPYDTPYRINTGGGLSAEEFWQYRPQGASYRGVELFTPGCMAHLFYLVALNDWLEQGMVQPSDEIERALTDMMTDVVPSPNHDAASYVLDVLSGTTSGPSLPAGPAETWAAQRNIVNRYFAQLGWLELRSINLNQKTWHSNPYGRERDFLGQAFNNQNQLTTEAIARLMHSIVGGVSVSSVRSQQMMDLLQRSSPSSLASAASDIKAPNVKELNVKEIKPDSLKIWSQASADEEGTHAVAYIEADGIHPYILTIFSTPPRFDNGRLIKGSQTEQPPASATASEAVISFIAQQIFAQSQQNFNGYES